mgnify:CR=1 FL=1
MKREVLMLPLDFISDYLFLFLHLGKCICLQNEVVVI